MVLFIQRIPKVNLELANQRPAFQITDKSRVNDPTVAALWPDSRRPSQRYLFIFHVHGNLCQVISCRGFICMASHTVRGEAAFSVGLLGWHCLLPLMLSGECVHLRAAVCVHKGKMSSFRHSYNCKCKHEVTNFFIRVQGNKSSASSRSGNWMLLLKKLFYVLSCFFHCWNHDNVSFLGRPYQ